MNVAVLLSGGVDSSVALALLRRRTRHALTAFYLKIWLEEEVASLGDCPWEEDLSYARAVCDRLGVSLEVVSLQREYYERVVAYALDELRAGRTPSPDIFCNRRIKFGVFRDFAAARFDKIASGHYARIEEAEGRFRLRRSPDPVKDQSYFLSHLTQAQVARALFPIGGMEKRTVRALAEELDLPTKHRKDSQGICFLGRIRYRDFVRHYLGERPGPIVEEETGARVGEHRGYWFHTIGQRAGLGLGSGPWYVVGKDTASDVVYVSRRARPEARGRWEFVVGEPSWIDGPPAFEAGSALRLHIKLRHGPELRPCAVAPLDGGSRLAIRMDAADAGVAPGQFAVFYQGDLCLGGAKIEA